MAKGRRPHRIVNTLTGDWVPEEKKKRKRPLGGSNRRPPVEGTGKRGKKDKK